MRRIRTSLALILIPAGVVLAAQTAPPKKGTGAISGVVIDGQSNQPVSGAIVALGGSSEALLASETRQVTDDKGRFVFVDLPASPSYTISATKYGYLLGGHGREVSSADPLRPIRLQNAEWVPNVRVLLWRPGSISGMVRDETGEPVVGVYVRALLRFRMIGRDQLAAGPMTVTDDRGAYRLSGLEPGQYVIQVPSLQASIPSGARYRSGPGNEPDAAIGLHDSTRLVVGRYPLPPLPIGGRPRAYPSAFHPAATAIAQTTIIALKLGDHRSGVDVALTPESASRVSGIVDGPAEALSFLTLRLLPAGLESLGQGGEIATAQVGADGQFTFLNVPAGTYTLDAPRRIAELVTTLDRRVAFPMPPGRSGWQRQMEPIQGTPGLHFVSSDFRGNEVAHYSGRSSVTVGATDVDGIVIRLKAHATMSGRVVPATDRADAGPVPDFSVMLDPASGETSLDNPRGRAPAKASEPGQFAISGIGPGSYWLRLHGPQGWLVKSILWKGRDFTLEPFDAAAVDDFSGVVVTVTSAVPELSGAVRGSQDLPTDRAMVVVFHANPAQWRGAGLWPPGMRSAPVSSDGTFRLTTLPAGEYLVAAIDRAHLAVWRDPDFLADLQRSATRVTLNWGTKSTHNISVVTVRREAAR